MMTSALFADDGGSEVSYSDLSFNLDKIRGHIHFPKHGIIRADKVCINPNIDEHETKMYVTYLPKRVEEICRDLDGDGKPDGKWYYGTSTDEARSRQWICDQLDEVTHPAEIIYAGSTYQGYKWVKEKNPSDSTYPKWRKVPAKIPQIRKYIEIRCEIDDYLCEKPSRESVDFKICGIDERART